MIYKAGIIGCGRIGCGFDDDNPRFIRTHAGAYSKYKKTSLIALCDLDKKKLKKYGAKYKISNLFIDYKDMFKKLNLDIVSLCTFTESHHSIVKEAIKNGVRGIFLEKPIADNLENSNKIAELCKKNNVKLVIDYQREFIPIYQKLRNFLKTKKLGNIQKIIVHYGGGIANTGSHIFDILLLFFGPVKTIDAKFHSNNIKNELDPNLDVTIVFKNKIIGILNSLDVNNYGVLEMDIFGTKGRIKMDMVKHKVNLFEISKKGFVYNELNIRKEITAKKENEPIVKAIENLVYSIEKKSIPSCSLIQGYGSLELVVSAMISASRNKVISLPIQNLKFKINSK